MNKMKIISGEKLLKCIAVFITSCMINFTVIAGELPSNYPSTYQWSGTVDDITATSIVIEDRVLPISSNVSVHLLKSHNATIRDIKVGMTAGCELSADNKLISIWQLPESLSSTSGPLRQSAVEKF